MIFSVGRLAESDRLPRNAAAFAPADFLPGRDRWAAVRSGRQIKGFSFIVVIGVFMGLDGTMSLFCKVAVRKIYELLRNLVYTLTDPELYLSLTADDLGNFPLWSCPRTGSYKATNVITLWCLNALICCSVLAEGLNWVLQHDGRRAELSCPVALPTHFPQIASALLIIAHQNKKEWHFSEPWRAQFSLRSFADCIFILFLMCFQLACISSS